MVAVKENWPSYKHCWSLEKAYQTQTASQTPSSSTCATFLCSVISVTSRGGGWEIWPLCVKQWCRSILIYLSFRIICQLVLVNKVQYLRCTSRKPLYTQVTCGIGVYSLIGWTQLEFGPASKYFAAYSTHIQPFFLYRLLFQQNSVAEKPLADSNANTVKAHFFNTSLKSQKKESVSVCKYN